MKVRVLLIHHQPVTASVAYGVDMQAAHKRVESIELFSGGTPAYFFGRNLGSGVLMCPPLKYASPALFLFVHTSGQEHQLNLPPCCVCHRWSVDQGESAALKEHLPTPFRTSQAALTGFGFNIQATCDANYRVCSVSIIAPGAANDWSAWTRSSLARATMRLPDGYHNIGDAAYPTSEKILTPYPGKSLPEDQDSFNFHLCQLRVKIEQSFGMLVSTWGILWRPLSKGFAGRTDLIVALFHMHNFCRDEQTKAIAAEEQDHETGKGRILLATGGILPPACKSAVQPAGPAAKPTRSGETPTRAAITARLAYNRQFRPKENILRNANITTGCITCG